ncbi:hypothetical protein [Blastococcus xanthinilyticus]|uniref:Integral membrane plasmid transfer protein n=1 Tax=Blastococcus xanthinilyticus TaxID=1564164 RepID=A0A5S5CSV4_9ACTN|nr:hypothetical protein [Blastococcus xanthinilyticus]TYP86881.1 hypothetical protein BD833_108166 [Blastococcus xanthinilyticus]
MAGELTQLAYDEARAALREQDATLTSVRNRATGLLGAAAVATSFSTTVGLLNVDPARGGVLPTWAGWVLLFSVALIGVGVMVVLWPAPDWNFGPSARKLLDSVGAETDVVMQAATRAMIAGMASNDRRLERRMTAYRASVVVLMAQLVLLVLAMIQAQG